MNFTSRFINKLAFQYKDNSLNKKSCTSFDMLQKKQIMKKLILALLISSFFSCQKDEPVQLKAELVKCGTMHITSDGGPFRYQLGTSLQIQFAFITQDTTFDIYENELYRIYYKGTTIQSVDSVWFDPGGGPTADSVFIRVDTTYDYHVIEHQTGTGSQSFDHVLPSTIYDR